MKDAVRNLKFLVVAEFHFFQNNYFLIRWIVSIRWEKIKVNKMSKFFNWLKNNKSISNPKKGKYFHQLKTIWEVSTKTKIPEMPDTNEEWIKLQNAISREEKKTIPARSKPAWGYNPRFAYIAATIILIVVSSFYIHRFFSFENYQTNRKEQLSFMLSDSSKIQLNSVSKLTVSKNFNEDSRQVFLKGEAYFKIKKGDFPFIIKTDVTTVRVVGTQFNVKSRDDLLEVAVNQGVVNVLASSDSTLILTEGQFSICQKGGLPTAPQKLQFDLYPGWTHGYLAFYQAELKSVCREIERRYDISIQFADKQLETISITGLLETNELSNLLTALCLLTQKEFRYDGKRYIIF